MPSDINRRSRVKRYLPLVFVIAVLLPESASAAAPRLVIVAPGHGALVAGAEPVRARLTLSKKLRIRSVRFFLQGRLINTDRKAPFAIKRGATIDTAGMVIGKQRLAFTATYRARNARGRTVKRTVKRKLPVDVFRPPSPLFPTDWIQAFDDGFDSPSNSAALWRTQRDDWIKGGSPYNNLEGAGYLPSNVSIADGLLSIKIASTPAAGFPLSTGSVNTHRRFAISYGYIESRILVPACDGCWPAFWMLPGNDSWPPEIDIIEFFNTAAESFPYASLHWSTTNSGHESRSDPLRANPADSYVGTWHTYGMLWTANDIRFYIDGVPGPQHSVPSQIPDEAMYPILQLAVRSGHQPPAGSTMHVDYVRAWRPEKQ